MMTNSRWYGPKEAKDEMVLPSNSREVDLKDCLWEGETSKGLALVRARKYNETADLPVTAIKQCEDGSIEYYSESGSIIETVWPPTGRHKEDSLPGEVKV